MPGEELMILSNPRGRRRHNKRRSKSRSKPKQAKRAAAPRRRRKQSAARKVPAQGYVIGNLKTHRIRRRKLNPRFSINRLIEPTVKGAMPAAIGALSAVASDFLISFAPWDKLKTGPMRHVTRVLGAALLGGVSGLLVKPETARTIGTGALSIALHGAFVDAIKRFAPDYGARLGDNDLEEIDLDAIEPDALNAFEPLQAFEPIAGLGSTFDPAFQPAISGLAGDDYES